jgi:DNA-binding transcriptional regulator YiaG
MDRCAHCGNRTFRPASAPEVIRVGELEFRAEVPVVECRGCGARFADGDARERAAQRTALWLAEQGARTKEAFRFMRKAIGMRAAELAELVGVGPETVSRWETGKRDISHCALALLGQLVIDRIRQRDSFVGRLRNLRADSVPAMSSVVELGEV